MCVPTRTDIEHLRCLVRCASAMCACQHTHTHTHTYCCHLFTVRVSCHIIHACGMHCHLFTLRVPARATLHLMSPVHTACSSWIGCGLCAICVALSLFAVRCVATCHLFTMCVPTRQDVIEHLRCWVRCGIAMLACRRTHTYCCHLFTVLVSPRAVSRVPHPSCRFCGDSVMLVACTVTCSHFVLRVTAVCITAYGVTCSHFDLLLGSDPCYTEPPFAVCCGGHMSSVHNLCSVAIAGCRLVLLAVWAWRCAFHARCRLSQTVACARSGTAFGMIHLVVWSATTVRDMSPLRIVC
jgi:hypothetical protein